VRRFIVFTASNQETNINMMPTINSNKINVVNNAPTNLPEEGFNQLFHANNSFLLNVFPDKTTKPTYDELLRIEERRGKFIPRSYLGNLFILATWRHTVLRYLIFDFQFWCTIVIYAIVRVYFNRLDLPLTALGIIVGFISFLLTFYLNNVITRYFAFYNACMGILGTIWEITWLTRCVLSEDVAIQIVKYVNIAQILGYIELEPNTFTFGNMLEPLNDKYEYIGEVDMAKLRFLRVDGTGAYHREVINWAVDLVQNEVKTNNLSDYRAVQLFEKLFNLRSAIGTLFVMRDVPMPFVYVHFLYLLSAIYMPLFAVLVANNFPYALNAETEIVGAVCVLLNCAFIIGLRDICYRLALPFGLRDEAFQVISYIQWATEDSLRLFGKWADAHIIANSKDGKAEYVKSSSSTLEQKPSAAAVEV